MPYRILREGILTSEPVDQLTVHAEVFYRRLMSVVDDFGRYDARPNVLRAGCFPLRIDKVREADISRWIAECEKAGLIALYTVDGKKFLQYFKTEKPRAKNSRYPEPTAAILSRVRAYEDTCAHMRPYSNPNALSNSSAHSNAGNGVAAKNSKKERIAAIP